jgi:hypothetical protein
VSLQPNLSQLGHSRRVFPAQADVVSAIAGRGPRDPVRSRSVKRRLDEPEMLNAFIGLMHSPTSRIWGGVYDDPDVHVSS